MYLTATGLVCSVGLSAASACAAMRAGIAGFTDLPYRDNRGEPVVGAMVPGLEPDWPRERRLVELLAQAVQDCLGREPDRPVEEVPLLVGLAEPDRPGGGAGLAGRIIGLVQDRLGIRFHPTLSQVFSAGHTAGFRALRTAQELVRGSAIPTCLVCGVDSYVSAAALHWLDRHQRLKTPENADGVIPGEAAAAVLVRRGQPAEGSVVRVAGLGFDVEQAPILGDEPLLGLGLAEALRGAVAEAGAPLHEIGVRLADVTGEAYGFKEHTLALARALRQASREMPIWHPAETIGDSGAAAGVVQLVVAAQAAGKGYLPGRWAACFTSAVPGERAVAILERP